MSIQTPRCICDKKCFQVYGYHAWDCPAKPMNKECCILCRPWKNMPCNHTTNPLCCHNCRGKFHGGSEPICECHTEKPVQERKLNCCGANEKDHVLCGAGIICPKPVQDKVQDRVQEETVGENTARNKEWFDKGVAQERTRIEKAVEGMKPFLWNDDPIKHVRNVEKYNTIDAILKIIRTTCCDKCIHECSYEGCEFLGKCNNSHCPCHVIHTSTTDNQ